ncbi:MAG: hypothetical protein WC868_08665 [Bacteroidales bacterium]
MKTKVQQIGKICIVLAIAMLSTNSQIYAQGNTWKLTLNSNVGPNDGVGTENFADLNFFTNNQKRFTITKDGIFLIGGLGIMKGFNNTLVADGKTIDSKKMVKAGN